MSSPIQLDAATTHPEWSEDRELHLWGEHHVIIYGLVADIRALLARSLEQLPPERRNQR